MKLVRSVFFVLIGSLFFSLAAVVQASDYRLNVQYSLSDVTMTETGTKVTLDMTVNNTEDAALNNLTLLHKQMLLEVSAVDQNGNTVRPMTIIKPYAQ